MCPKLIELLSWNGPTVHFCCASIKAFVSRIHILQPSPKTAKKVFVSRKNRQQGHSLAEVSLYYVADINNGSAERNVPTLLEEKTQTLTLLAFKRAHNTLLFLCVLLRVVIPTTLSFNPAFSVQSPTPTISIQSHACGFQAIQALLWVQFGQTYCMLSDMQ